MITGRFGVQSLLLLLLLFRRRGFLSRDFFPPRAARSIDSEVHARRRSVVRRTSPSTTIANSFVNSARLCFFHFRFRESTAFEGRRDRRRDRDRHTPGANCFFARDNNFFVYENTTGKTLPTTTSSTRLLGPRAMRMRCDSAAGTVRRRANDDDDDSETLFDPVRQFFPSSRPYRPR